MLLLWFLIGTDRRNRREARAERYAALFGPPPPLTPAQVRARRSDRVMLVVLLAALALVLTAALLLVTR